MSAGPQPPGQSDPTLPQPWPEPPTVPGMQVSLEPSAWPEQPPPWPEQPPPWPEQPPPWPQQPPARSQQPTGPQGQGSHGRSALERERYAIRPPAERYGQRYAPGQQAPEWTPLPMESYEMQPVMVAPKSPAGSVLLSIFIPGLGSMVNDNAGVGVTILILNIIGWILAIVLIGIPLALGTWIWGLVDAHQSAQRWNRAHGIIS
jgi:TM2 domain-containing membrane protein YozV